MKRTPPQDSRARLAGGRDEVGIQICPRRAFLACLALHAPRSVALADCFSILLVVEDDIEEGAVHVDATVVVLQEAQLPELIHEETHP